MASMTTAVEDFLRHVLRSGLLDRERLQAALRSVPRELRDDAQAIADHLTDRNLLTPYQAQKLLRGLTGGLVIGCYQVQAPLGRGGMGMVYLALDTQTGRHVALKILRPKKQREAERHLLRFQREVELSKRVSHPHIAQTLDAGQGGGFHYIVMEYIPGQTLYRLVSQEGILSVPRAARLFAEVAAALSHAHAVGLIHRDLKPSNIMVTPHDHAKVLDMGLAFMVGEEVEDLEVTGGRGYIVGSIDYMAPEQTCDATDVDPRSDLYALGCCLYFALTGKPPFPVGGTRDKALAHRQTEPTLLVSRNPDVPGPFAALVHKLLAKDAAQRFGSATELEAALVPWGQTGGWVGPVETTGDGVFKDAVRQAVADWPRDDTSIELLRDEPVPPPSPPQRNFAERVAAFYERMDDDGRRFWKRVLLLGGLGIIVLMLLVLLSRLR